MGTWIFLGIIVLIILWLLMSYNGLVGLRQRCKQAFGDIDVQLKQRHDLIPNLVETAKGYLKHERETLEALVRVEPLRARRLEAERNRIARIDRERMLAEAAARAQHCYEALRALEDTQLPQPFDRLSAAQLKEKGADASLRTLRQRYDAAIGEIGRAHV